MSVFNSISVSVLIVLLFAGLIMGLTAAGTDLFNPITSEAEADRIRANTEHDAILNKLTEEREKAKTEAEIASIQRLQEAEQKRFEEEMNFIEQLHARKLIAYDRWVQVRDTLIIIFTVAISTSLFVLATAKAVLTLRATPVQATRLVTKEEIKENWQKRRELARENERWFRTTTLLEARMKAAKDYASLTKEQRDNLPLGV